MKVLRVIPGFHLYVSPDAWWIGMQVTPSVARGKCWLAVQPLPCVGFAFRVRA